MRSNALLRLDNWYLVEKRVLSGPDGKVTMDGYLEIYHPDSVHGEAVGPHTIGNPLVLAAKAPASDDERAATEQFSEFLFGRNKTAVQHCHNWVARFTQQDADINRAGS